MKTIPVNLSDKQTAYINDLIKEEGFGENESDVTQHLIWRGIEVIICRGLLDRRKGKYTSKKKTKNNILVFEIHPQLMLYLKLLVQFGLHGNDVNECAWRLISKQIEQLIIDNYFMNVDKQLKLLDICPTK